MDGAPEQEVSESPPKTRRLRRYFGRALVVLCIALLLGAYLLKDYCRTLSSLRRIPGTKAYVMDYYVDYHIDEVRVHGIDVAHIEDSVIGVLLPKWTHPIAAWLKPKFLSQPVKTIPTSDHCSTVMLHANGGDVYFGRNLDYFHDAYLILKVHGQDGNSSVAVLDLHYLNLDQDNLEQSSIFRRLPLLFAPYYLEDGMNQSGVAVSDMAVHGVRAPYDPAKPNLIHSMAMRLILDYAKNVDEAVELLKQYNIHFVAETCHYMIADASGKSVVVEFIDGELRATPTAENWQVCTNHRISGKSEEENDASCTRYHMASDELADIEGPASANDVMKVMESVKQRSTMWSSVYDLTTGDFRVAYRQHYEEPYADRLEMCHP